MFCDNWTPEFEVNLINKADKHKPGRTKTLKKLHDIGIFERVLYEKKSLKTEELFLNVSEKHHINIYHSLRQSPKTFHNFIVSLTNEDF